jgi:hypothetical protein
MQHQVGPEHVKCEKVLTDAAKSIISRDLESGVHKEKKDRREPPFMAPSPNPDDYSIVCFPAFSLTVAYHLQWCSFCNDYGAFLLLCAGCRVGICSKSPETSTGCLKWKPVVSMTNFVFYCPWCANKKKYQFAVCMMDLSLPQSLNPVSAGSPAEATAAHLRRLVQIRSTRPPHRRHLASDPVSVHRSAPPPPPHELPR